MLFIQDEFLIFLFAIGGASLKLADFYGERESRAVAYMSASVTAVVFGLLISHSQTSSSIIIGIIIGVFLSKKVNQLNLIFGFILTLLTAFILQFELPIPWLLSTVAIFSFIDEISHDRFVSKRKFLVIFFLLRPFLKLAVIAITALSLIQVVYTVGFFCFDISYDLTSWALNRFLTKY